MARKRRTARSTPKKTSARVRAQLPEPTTLLRPDLVAGVEFARLERDDNIAVEVIDAISRAANYPSALIQLHYVLQEQPLGLDAQDLHYLAERLTALVHRTRPDQSVRRAELGTTGLKVGDVITLTKGKLA